MGRLIGSSTVFPTAGGGKVKVRYRGTLAKNQGVPGVAQAVAEGRRWLQKADQRIHEDPLRWETQAALEHWMFMDSNGPSADELAWMKTVIGQARRGIAADMTIKVHQIREKGTDAFVPYWRRLRAFEGRLYWEDVHGRIHLDSDIFSDPQFATFVFVHEAFHKYADLDDYGEQGYSSVHGRRDVLWYRQPGLTKQQALLNAESYAHLAFYIWIN
jgi:hypothetical protein